MLRDDLVARRVSDREDLLHRADDFSDPRPAPPRTGAPVPAAREPMTPAGRFPTFYLSHGGGPWPFIDGPFRSNFAVLEASLREFPRRLGRRPEAILVVSGHWEERDFAVMSGAEPPMLYDFGGFPEHTYSVRYPAPGSPELARRVRALIEGAGLESRLDSARGFDHGTWSMLAVTHPEADVPVVQVSVRADFDPAAHLRLGRALAPLRDEGVVIVGSGSSYHNLRRFRDAANASARFDAWLTETLVGEPPERRSSRLLRWTDAPSARDAHPEEDHLIPLHVAVGAAEREPARVIYHQDDFFDGWTVSSYQFGS